MPYNTGWVGEWHPIIVERGDTGVVVQGPQGLLLRDVEGPIHGVRPTQIATLGA